jgi:hypothetical protein
MAYWAAPTKLKQPGMTADLPSALKSISIIVAPDFTVEQAAFLVMGLAASTSGGSSGEIMTASLSPATTSSR